MIWHVIITRAKQYALIVRSKYDMRIKIVVLSFLFYNASNYREWVSGILKIIEYVMNWPKGAPGFYLLSLFSKQKKQYL